MVNFAGEIWLPGSGKSPKEGWEPDASRDLQTKAPPKGG
jgi:hypothetical protein